VAFSHHCGISAHNESIKRSFQLQRAITAQEYSGGDNPIHPQITALRISACFSARL
jgi:hypothetical protein